MVAESIKTTARLIPNITTPKMMYGKIPLSDGTVDSGIVSLAYTLEEQI